MTNESQYIKDKLSHYCQLDDSIVNQRQAMSEMRKELVEMHDEILELLQGSKIDFVNVGEYGNITLKQKECKAPINKDLIKQGIYDTINENISDIESVRETIAERGAEYIMQNRETQMKTILKRSKVKKQKNAGR